MDIVYVVNTHTAESVIKVSGRWLQYSFLNQKVNRFIQEPFDGRTDYYTS